MGTLLRHILAYCLIAMVSACGGGGDSTSTSLRCGTANCVLLDPSVATAFVPTVNNMRLTVDDLGPHGGFGSTTSTNLLFATVTVCALGGTPGDSSQCATIDHVLVDTGSVGLRVFASKVSSLNLPPIPLSAPRHAWECYPFVIGGLWGPTAAADVWLGQQRATAIAVQLIDDQSGMAPPSDCVKVTDDGLLTSAGSLGANGILGIGSTTLDCGRDCNDGKYSVSSLDGSGSSALYYDNCPLNATDSSLCSLAAIPIAYQIFNPVAALAAPYNNGVVLKMPAIPGNLNGAATASGELILGVDGNNLPTGARKVFLGVADTASDSYLNIHTVFNNHTFAGAYLDTGTNGLFFYDSTIAACTSRNTPSYWYCPTDPLRNLQAVLSDGDNVALNPVTVDFQVANAMVLFSTSNTAFSSAAGAVNALDPVSKVLVPDLKTFAWGMPFFYGKQVYLSIWQQPGSENGPWYAWAPL